MLPVGNFSESALIALAMPVVFVLLAEHGSGVCRGY
jgi:hypothetical protein